MVARFGGQYFDKCRQDYDPRKAENSFFVVGFFWIDPYLFFDNEYVCADQLPMFHSNSLLPE
jgi:hypothetical protein